MSRDQISFGRRKVLKTTAVGLAGLAGAPITAKASPSSVINEAARLRSEKKDNDVFVEYLQERGFSVTTQQAETTIPAQSSDEGSYSAKSYNQKKDLTTNINIVQKGSSTQVDGFFKWRVSGGVKGGNRGASPDVVSIHWNKGKFKLNNTSTYEDWNEDRLTLYNTNGRKHAVWKFDDSHVGPGAIYDGSVKVEVEPSNAGPDSRFYLKYYHTWGKIKITGISLWGVSFSNKKNRWISNPTYVEW